MNKEVKKAILEAHQAQRERHLAEIQARIEARKAEHEKKLEAIRAKVEARREKRDQRKPEEPAVKVVPDPEVRAMKDAMMANVPVLQFPVDDPKYNSAEKHS